jgi:hypothetical protein
MKLLRYVLGILSAGLVIVGFAHILPILPQPVHVASLDGTGVGAFRDLPNWMVGIFYSVFGVVGLILAKYAVPINESFHHLYRRIFGTKDSELVS